VGLLLTRNANIFHAIWAVWRADTAAHIVKAWLAIGVPQEPILRAASVLLVAFFLALKAATSTIGFWLEAISAVIAPVSRALLPAHRS
jgi:hypothetical protein